jgi:hypothetical protein
MRVPSLGCVATFSFAALRRGRLTGAPVFRVRTLGGRPAYLAVAQRRRVSAADTLRKGRVFRFRQDAGR